MNHPISPLPSPLPSPSHNPNMSAQRIFRGVTSYDDYEILHSIGEGTFGVVFKAKHKKNGRLVALKQLRLENEKEGFPITAIREIKILKTLHNNTETIVELIDIATCKVSKSIYLVFEYMDSDLGRLLPKLVQPLSAPCIKRYVKQILEGLHVMHRKKIFHRDLKSANILVNKEGELKLADFGLSKQFQENDSKFTKKVVTLWYRPPELLLGAQTYSAKIDIWGVGCIMSELYRREPLFKSTYHDDNEGQIQQLLKIFEICGSCDDSKELTKLPDYQGVAEVKKERTLKAKFADINDPKAIDLLDQMLTLDPILRPDAKQLLDHDWFWQSPHPATAQDVKRELAAFFLSEENSRMAQTANKPPPVNNTNNTSNPPGNSHYEHPSKHQQHQPYNSYQPPHQSHHQPPYQPQPQHQPYSAYPPPHYRGHNNHPQQTQNFAEGHINKKPRNTYQQQQNHHTVYPPPSSQQQQQQQQPYHQQQQNHHPSGNHYHRGASSRGGYKS